MSFMMHTPNECLNYRRRKPGTIPRLCDLKKR